MCLLLIAGCDRKEGRISVILDNSGSMAAAGTSFEDIKQSLIDALILVPGSYEKGLRVFDDSGSRLVSPYHHSLLPLQSELKFIKPGGGTYIGDSLEDAATDLLEKPDGDNRFILITDGEGDEADIQKAQEVKQRLASLKGGFKCSFILFSKRENVLEETPIGRVSEILGCGLSVPADYASAPTLTTALQRIFGFDFYWLWIIISLLGYIVLVFLTAHLVFGIQRTQGMLPRHSRLSAIAFLLALLPLIIGSHIIGLLSWLSYYVWWLAIAGFAVPFIAAGGFGKKIPRKGRTYDDNPFA